MADGQKIDGQKKDEKQPRAKGEKRSSAQVAEKPSAEAPRHAAKERPRLRARFEKEVSQTLMKELDAKNPMAVPRLHKIVVNMGVGEATQNAKLIDPAVGTSVPDSMLKIVLLPEPFGPIRPRISPCSTRNDTLLTAVKPPKRFTNPLTVSTKILLKPAAGPTDC